MGQRRNSTCSTDNGSSHSHQDTRLTQVASNHSSSSPKHDKTDSPLMLSTTDMAHQAYNSTPSQSHPSMATPSLPSQGSKLSAAAAVHLDTLLVTGQRRSSRFDPNDTVDAVRKHIYDHWPDSWPQPKPASATYLRILHLGHILDNPETTLASRGCKPGATTVVHIIVRSVPPPEPSKLEQVSHEKGGSEASRTQRNADDHVSPGCSCVIC